MALTITTNARPTAPIVNFLFPEVADKDNLLKSDFLTEERSNPFVFAYMSALANIPSIAGAYQGGAATQAKYLKIIKDTVVPDSNGVYDPAWAETALQNINMPNISEIVLGLVSAAKKKNLETDHMSGYYASLGVEGIPTGKICKLINAVKIYFPEITSLPNYDKIRYDDVWQDYRETLTSWQSILKKCSPEMVKAGVVTQPDADRLLKLDTKVKANINECPKNLLLMMAVYMEAADKLPAKWYQGQRALSEQDPKKVKALVLGWKRYFALGSDETEINGATTRDEVIAAIKKIS